MGSFTCVGAQFWRTQAPILCFFANFGNVKKACLHSFFFCVHVSLLVFLLGCLWASFGALSEPLSSLWGAGVILLGVFGLRGLPVGSLCYFL